MSNVFTHSIGVVYKNDEGAITSTTHTYTNDTEQGVDALVPAGATNKEWDIAITVANMKSMVLYSDQNVTLKTNSTSSPQDTINLVAGKEIIYTSDGAAGGAIPFAGNVTKFYITNGGLKDANFKYRGLLQQGV
jgi:hypothetical protein